MFFSRERKPEFSHFKSQVCRVNLRAGHAGLGSGNHHLNPQAPSESANLPRMFPFGGSSASDGGRKILGVVAPTGCASTRSSINQSIDQSISRPTNPWPARLRERSTVWERSTIRERSTNGHVHSVPLSAFSIPASTSGAMIAYPASVGCTPSLLRFGGRPSRLSFIAVWKST